MRFAEGVLFAKKDFNLAKHPLIESVPNLQVIKLMQSFKSKEYVRETFAWMHYYWFLTNEGIEFLRTYLNLPSDVVPATLKKSAKPIGRPFGGGPPGDRPRFDFFYETLLLGVVKGCSFVFLIDVLLCVVFFLEDLGLKVETVLGTVTVMGTAVVVKVKRVELQLITSLLSR